MSTSDDLTPPKYPILMTPDSLNQINFDARVRITDFVKHKSPTLKRYMRSSSKLFFVREHFDNHGKVSDIILSVYHPHLTPHRTMYHTEFVKKVKIIYQIIKQHKQLLKSVETVRHLNRKLTLAISETVDFLEKANEIRYCLEHAYSIKANRLSMARFLVYSTTHMRHK